MNIFAISPCPIISGQRLPDVLCVKMPLEVSQMLSTALRLHGYEGDDIYKAAHRHHPCTKWAAETTANYRWLLQHGISLGKEYSLRYKRIHKSSLLLPRFQEVYRDYLPDGNLTPFAQAMPEEFKDLTDAHKAYRAYMQSKHYFQSSWKKGRDFRHWYGGSGN